MAETVIAAVDAPNKWSAVGQALTMTALDNTNGNKFLAYADQLVIVQNTSGGALTFQMTSQALGTYGRTGNVSQSLAAAEIRVFRVTRDGWEDVNGYILLPTGQSASLKIAILKLA